MSSPKIQQNFRNVFFYWEVIPAFYNFFLPSLMLNFFNSCVFVTQHTESPVPVPTIHDYWHRGRPKWTFFVPATGSDRKSVTVHFINRMKSFYYITSIPPSCFVNKIAQLPTRFASWPFLHFLFRITSAQLMLLRSKALTFQHKSDKRDYLKTNYVRSAWINILYNIPHR